LVANPEIRMASKFKAFGDGRGNHYIMDTR